MFLFEKLSASLAMNFVLKPYSEPLLITIFGVFLIAVAIGIRRVAAFFSLAEIQHPTEQAETQAKSMTGAWLGDFPSETSDTSPPPQLDPFPDNEISSCSTVS